MENIAKNILLITITMAPFIAIIKFYILARFFHPLLIESIGK